jgi:hypothetical protein
MEWLSNMMWSLYVRYTELPSLLEQADRTGTNEPEKETSVKYNGAFIFREREENQTVNTVTS